MSEDRLLLPREAMDYLRISYNTLRRLTHQGVIPALRVGAMWRYRKEDLGTWVRGGDAAEAVPDEAAVPRDPNSQTTAWLAEYDRQGRGSDVSVGLLLTVPDVAFAWSSEFVSGSFKIVLRDTAYDLLEKQADAWAQLATGTLSEVRWHASDALWAAVNARPQAFDEEAVLDLYRASLEMYRTSLDEDFQSWRSANAEGAP
jgi:excisionase family DNA binding protein